MQQNQGIFKTEKHEKTRFLIFPKNRKLKKHQKNTEKHEKTRFFRSKSDQNKSILAKMNKRASIMETIKGLFDTRFLVVFGTSRKTPNLTSF